MDVTSIRAAHSAQLRRALAPVEALPVAAAQSTQTVFLNTQILPLSECQQRFATMASRFRPDKAKGVTATFQFNISGAGGGKWYAIVKDGKCIVKPGTAPGTPTVTFEASDEHWVKISKGEMNSKWAYLTRKLKIDGDKDMAGKLKELFPNVQ